MKKEGFKIIGISVKTSNENGQSQKDMGQLWGKFHSENILEKIPNKVSDEIISIYTDYESDYKGPYTAILGVQVSDLKNIPCEMIGREFPSETFKKFTAKGEIPAAVGKEWKEIWSNDEELHRKYSYDYEVYGKKSQNQNDAEVEIFVSIKE